MLVLIFVCNVASLFVVVLCSVLVLFVWFDVVRLAHVSAAQAQPHACSTVCNGSGSGWQDFGSGLYPIEIRGRHSPFWPSAGARVLFPLLFSSAWQTHFVFPKNPEVLQC